jgi:hypothetical protein
MTTSEINTKHSHYITEYRNTYKMVPTAQRVNKDRLPKKAIIHIPKENKNAGTTGEK